MKCSNNSVLKQLGITIQSDNCSKETSRSLIGILSNIQNYITHNPDCDDTRLVVFTDGACSHNGSRHAKAGYAVVWPYNRCLDSSKRLVGYEQTNNRAEYSALIEAQNIADSVDPTGQKPLYVYTDSQLLINSISKWIHDWKKNNWKKADKKPVLNQDLLKKIDANPRSIVFKHVRAHTGKKDWESIYNEEADRLARNSIL